MRKPVLDKVKPIRDMPEPTTKRALSSFIGALNFFRAYLSNFAHHGSVLTDLTKAHVKNKIVFTDVEREAFNTLKQKLCEATALFSPDYSAPFIIHADSSQYAVGASLTQLDEHTDCLKPIAFTSKKLSETERRWSVSELEAYSVIHALKAFDYFVYGSEIKLYSDNSPLHCIGQSASVSPKLSRWALSLNKYKISVEHIAGSQNVVADMLSRSVAAE